MPPQAEVTRNTHARVLHTVNTNASISIQSPQIHHASRQRTLAVRCDACNSATRDEVRGVLNTTFSAEQPSSHHTAKTRNTVGSFMHVTELMSRLKKTTHCQAFHVLMCSPDSRSPRMYLASSSTTKSPVELGLCKAALNIAREQEADTDQSYSRISSILTVIAGRET